MHIAVVGSSGYIGRALVAYLVAKGHEVLRIGRSDNADVPLELRQAERFAYERLEGVECVVFTAAISGPDKCAVENEVCWNVNVTGTGYFIEEALSRGCRVLFFSSDAVYASHSGEIYDEGSSMEPQTPYGKMKQAIEDRFHRRHGFKAVRLSYVVSSADKFMSYLQGCKEKHSTAELFHPYYRNVIMLNEVLIAINWLLNHWWEYEPSVLCLAGDALISRLRMADELNEMDDMQIEYRIVIPDEFFFKIRPKVTRMRSRYLYELGIIPRRAFIERFRQQIRGEEK